MNLPTGIDKATWALALTNAGLWRAGQRCLTENGGRIYCAIHDTRETHDIPMPAVTPALLWEMLEKYRISLWWSPSNKCWQAHLEGGLTVSGETAAAAVIRAMAAREVK